jgi:hypothetical protein
VLVNSVVDGVCCSRMAYTLSQVMKDNLLKEELMQSMKENAILTTRKQWRNEHWNWLSEELGWNIGLLDDVELPPINPFDEAGVKPNIFPLYSSAKDCFEYMLTPMKQFMKQAIEES